MALFYEDSALNFRSGPVCKNSNVAQSLIIILDLDKSTNHSVQKQKKKNDLKD